MCKSVHHLFSMQKNTLKMMIHFVTTFFLVTATVATIPSSQLLNSLSSSSSPTRNAINHLDQGLKEVFNNMTNNNNLTPTKMMTRKKRSFSMERFVELMIVADHKMKTYHQESVKLYILTLMSMVNKIYKDSSIGNEINIIVSKLIIMDENESRKIIKSSAPSTLRGFCWWQENYLRKSGHYKYHDRHDAAILITREDLCSSHGRGHTDSGYNYGTKSANSDGRTSACDTLGLAQLGRMCDPHSSCAVIEDNGLSAAFTIAHELAHILNIPHDDDPSCSRFISKTSKSRNEIANKDRFIMSRMLHYHGHPWSWSACSRGRLTEFLDSSNADCLLNTPKVDLLNQQPNESPIGSNEVPKVLLPVVTSPPLQSKFYNSKEFRSPEADELGVVENVPTVAPPVDTGQRRGSGLNTSNLMPGEIFDMNVQCQLVFGPSSKICPWMSVCSRLWCLTASGRSCKTQHMPWAEGTHCGQDKWCMKGSCVPINRSITPRINGKWGPWSRFTPCSRSCGGGINQSTRECNNPRPQNGGKYCVGHRIKYSSCNTQDCPPNEPDFRSTQCSAFDGQTFGLEHLPAAVRWQAHYSNDTCKLFCNPIGTSAYYLLKSKVKDGTPCKQDSDEICVNGQCMSAGCDHVIGSNKIRDKCSVCGGDNSSCKLITGSLTPSKLKFGYNSILSLPANSSNVRIIQKSGSGHDSNHIYNRNVNDINFLSLRDDQGKYLINGNFIVNPDKSTIQIDDDHRHKLNIEYSGYKVENESITIKEQLNKRMFVELLSVGEMKPPEVLYQYSIALPVQVVDQKVKKRRKKKVRYGTSSHAKHEGNGNEVLNLRTEKSSKKRSSRV